MKGRALPLVLLASLVLLNLSTTARYCVGYQTNPEIGIDGIGVLDRPRWDAHVPRHRPDEVWFWLATGNENGVEGDSLYFFLANTGFWSFLTSTGLALAALWNGGRARASSKSSRRHGLLARPR